MNDLTKIDTIIFDGKKYNLATNNVAFDSSTGTVSLTNAFTELGKDSFNGLDTKYIISEEYKEKERITKHKEAEAFNKARFTKLFDKASIILANPAVILYIDGKKFIAKAETTEEFDPEKGLMSCLLKWKGITTSDIEKLLDRKVTTNTQK